MRLLLLLPLAAQVACRDGTRPEPGEPFACGAVVDLPVGGVCMARPSATPSVAVAGGGSGAEFVAISYNDAGFARATASVTAAVTGAVAVVGPPTPVVVPAAAAARGEMTPTVLPDVQFERRLRQRERRDLLPLVAAARARRADALRGRLGARYAAAAIDPASVQVGDMLTLNANSSESCTNPINKQGRVVKVSQNAVIVEDLDNPAGGFSDADYDDLVAAFESVIWPTDVEAFGQPSDIDGNGRVLIFFTVEVNKLTAPGSLAFVGGFFFSRDLFPRTSTVVNGRPLQACPSSNLAEMFYMLAPDPGAVFGNERTRDFVKRITPGTIAHELQHLINSSRRLYINMNARFPEQTWLDEGLSHIAEELAYFRAAGRAPRQNLDSAAVRQHLEAVNTYQVANLGRLRAYVRATPSQSWFGESTPSDDDLETRGATWSLLRWAADHRGGAGDGDTWMRLANSVDTGVTNLRGVFGSDIGARARDWSVANYTDGAVSTERPEFRHPSWNYRSVLPLLEPMEGPPRRYQLNTVDLGAQSPATFSLVDGGAAYLRFGVPANTSATVQFTTAMGVAVWFVRTK